MHKQTKTNKNMYSAPLGVSSGLTVTQLQADCHSARSWLTPRQALISPRDIAKSPRNFQELPRDSRKLPRNFSGSSFCSPEISFPLKLYRG